MHINDALPFHPRTGLQAIGFTRRGPIWPALGGSEDADPTPDPAPEPAPEPASDPTPAPQGDPDKGEPASTFQAITSQADLDRILGRRVAQERAKYAGHDEALAKAAKYDELEQSKKTTEQQLSERLRAIEEENATLKVDKLRGDVAAEKAEEVAERLGNKEIGPRFAKLLAKRLSGKTREELEVDADELLDDLIASLPKPEPTVTISQKPRENLRGGGKPAEEPEETDPRKLAAMIPRR